MFTHFPLTFTHIQRFNPLPTATLLQSMLASLSFIACWKGPLLGHSSACTKGHYNPSKHSVHSVGMPCPCSPAVRRLRH